MRRKLLCVDDEEVIRITMAAILNQHGFDVTTAATVTEALQKITSEKFDVLLSDLNIGNPGDGLTVVSAMRRTQPEAVTMILTGYPAFQTALEAIRQQVDDYIVKPADIPSLVSAIERKLATPRERQRLPPPQRAAMLLQQNIGRIEELWLSAVESDRLLSRVPVEHKQRIEYFRSLLNEIIRAAQSFAREETVDASFPSTLHMTLREFTGCTPSMILTEFCLLRKVLSQVVQENLLVVNLSYIIPDLALVNECLDTLAKVTLEMLFGPVQGETYVRA